MKVSIVIPTLNEEAGIGPTLDSIDRDAFRQLGWDLELVIVDGASKDRTQAEAKQRGARVIIEPRKGYGRAYKTGLAAADGDIIVTGDADTTYPFGDAHKLVQRLIDEKLDFLTTDRFAKLAPGAMTFRNQLGNRVLSWTLRGLFFRRVRDSQSGMWVFRRAVLDRLSPLESFHDGMPFSEEIKIEAFCRPAVKAKEVPIAYGARTGEVKLSAWRDGLANLGYLLRKRMRFRATDAMGHDGAPRSR